MDKPAAKLGDEVMGIDTHIVMIPSPGGPVPTPLPTSFKGPLMESLCSSVEVENMPGATKDSVALSNPPHVPAGGPFQKPP
ncbi:MAG: PAAR domain-containing protein, partial [Myxococcota bacterium]